MMSKDEMIQASHVYYPEHIRTRPEVVDAVEREFTPSAAYKVFEGITDILKVAEAANGKILYAVQATEPFFVIGGGPVIGEYYSRESDARQNLYPCKMNGAEATYHQKDLEAAILAGYPPDGWIACFSTDAHGEASCVSESGDYMLELYREVVAEDGYAGTEADFQVDTLLCVGISKEAARKYVQGWDK